MDVDALLDSELERRTEIGVQMANMLARGQAPEYPMDRVSRILCDIFQNHDL